MHGSSYGLSDQIKKYKSTLRTKVQKYRSTNVQKKNIKSTKIQKIPGCQLWVQKSKGEQNIKRANTAKIAEKEHAASIFHRRFRRCIGIQLKIE